MTDTGTDPGPRRAGGPPRAWRASGPPPAAAAPASAPGGAPPRPSPAAPAAGCSGRPRIGRRGSGPPADGPRTGRRWPRCRPAAAEGAPGFRGICGRGCWRRRRQAAGGLQRAWLLLRRRGRNGRVRLRDGIAHTAESAKWWTDTRSEDQQRNVKMDRIGHIAVSRSSHCTRNL